jgi:Holliday junction resolvase-like predicted endonuclease
MIKSGALGELAAMKHFLGLGYEVYTAVTDSSTYDIILTKDGQLYRVEVKTTAARTKNDKGWVVHLKRVRPNKTQNKIHPFDSSRIDLLAVYITPLDRVLIFEARKLQQRSTLSILDEQLAKAV